MAHPLLEMAHPLLAALQDAFVRACGMDASLNDRHECFADAVRSFSASFADDVERLIARLKRSGAGLKAPAPGGCHASLRA
jgi:hypothetical protein